MEAILQVARSSIAIEENLIYHQIPQQPNAFQNKTKAKGEKPSNSFLHVMSKNYAKVHGGSIQVYEFFNCILNTEKLRYVPSVDYNIWLGYEMLNKHFVSLKESLVVSLQPPGRLKNIELRLSTSFIKNTYSDWKSPLVTPETSQKHQLCGKVAN